MSEQNPEGLFMRIWLCFDAIIGPVVDTLAAKRTSTLRRQPDAFPVMWEGGYGAVDGTPFVQTRERLEE